jgi:23S rRNA (pseudouridine1915-N3)-methyltransferase
MLTSPGLAELIEKRAADGSSHFVFVIGGSDGLDPAVTARADFRLCMSEMTFPHQMARLIILEQLYRAMKINNGEKYHK